MAHAIPRQKLEEKEGFRRVARPKPSFSPRKSEKFARLFSVHQFNVSVAAADFKEINEAGIAAFYLVKVEAIKIGDSSPAPLLTMIVGPSQESLDIGETKKELAERYTIRQKFWTGPLDWAKEKTKLHANITSGKYHWIGAGSGKRGLSYNYTIRKDEAVIELYIDRGKDAEQENQDIFEKLLISQQSIKEGFGDPLAWERLEGKRACRIQKVLTSGGYRNSEEEWPTIHEEMIDTMIRLESALKSPINRLNI